MANFFIEADAMVTIHPSQLFVVEANTREEAIREALLRFEENLENEYGWFDMDESNATIINQ